MLNSIEVAGAFHLSSWWT